LAELAALQKKLRIRFKDPSILEQALVHSSYVNENPAIALGDNERLEFLGDAVLGIVIAEELYQRLPELSEGEMTRLRASLVRQSALARMAKTIKLGDYLYMGKGEEASGGRQKPANLARALEALIAAVFLDRGLAAVRKFILKLAQKKLKETLRKGAEADYKSRLQEVTQASRQPKPKYRIIEATGPAHDRSFTIEVMVSNSVLGRGSGKSKKAAEAEAARAALARLPDNFTA
jgi:ribonuclease-3